MRIAELAEMVRALVPGTVPVSGLTPDSILVIRTVEGVSTSDKEELLKILSVLKNWGWNGNVLWIPWRASVETIEPAQLEALGYFKCPVDDLPEVKPSGKKKKIVETAVA